MLDLFGEEWVIDQILAERYMTQIAADAGSNVASLLRWLDADPERRERVNDARRKCAQLWEERAERLISEAKTPFELTKARDLAHHFRWRASKIAPRIYGDKVTQEHTGAGGAPLMPTTIVLEAPPSVDG